MTKLFDSIILCPKIAFTDLCHIDLPSFDVGTRNTTGVSLSRLNNVLHIFIYVYICIYLYISLCVYVCVSFLQSLVHAIYWLSSFARNNNQERPTITARNVIDHFDTLFGAIWLHTYVRGSQTYTMCIIHLNYMQNKTFCTKCNLLCILSFFLNHIFLINSFAICF